MISAKSLVIIKGVKEGLLFVLDDEAPFDEVLTELTYKLEHSHSQFLMGPLIHVHVHLGKRELTEKTRNAVKQAFSIRGNLLVQSIRGEEGLSGRQIPVPPSIKIVTGIVRSGQTLHYDADILLMGDVNPGGAIVSTGNVLIMGSLRGMAHAGIGGNQDAIIAASHLCPTQLRIADVVSRPPDEWGFSEAMMEFAYLRGGMMEIDKISRLHRVRPQFGKGKGE